MNLFGPLPSPFPKGRGWGFTQPGMHPQPPLPFPKGEGLGVGFPLNQACILNLPSPLKKGEGPEVGFPSARHASSTIVRLNRC